MDRNEKVHAIIHTAAAAATGVGAGMAQLPGSDAPVLMAIQTAMIMSLGSEHGVSLTKSSAADLVLTFSAAMVGRGISQMVLGWIPGLGNVLNALTAASITEAVGWAAASYLESPTPAHA